jgi:protein-tyrosine phosphatase
MRGLHFVLNLLKSPYGFRCDAMIDIHCHILPGVDDGSKSWEMSLEMCRMAADDGTEHIVATPHANDRYSYDRDRLLVLAQELQRRCGGKPEISLGCDFHLSYENFQNALVEPGKFAIRNTRYLLVELSNYSIPVQINDCFSQLAAKGITAVITHPERNPILQRSLERILRWVELGCVIQVTASALCGEWGEPSWRAAEWLLKHTAVHVLASDAHDTKRRVPGLRNARELVAESYGVEVAHSLVDANPRAIINGQSLPYFPEPTSA